MRAKRSKQYRKLMHQYELAFNFREPYQVLVDAEIIKAAARFKMQLGRMLENTLHGKIKPMITQCCIRHLYDADTGENDKAAKEAWIAVAKQAERRRCGHHELGEPLSALECIMSVVDPKGSGTNKHRYVVATQEVDVRRRLREVAGVPLIYINRSVMILEPMGEKTEDVREHGEKSKIRAGLKRRRDDGDDENKKKDSATDGDQLSQAKEEPEQKKQRKARGPKAPNPLSMKKSKKDKPTRASGQEVGAKTAPKTTGTVTSAQGVAATSDSAMDAGAATSETNSSQPKRRRKRKHQTDDGGQTAGAESAE